MTHFGQIAKTRDFLNRKLPLRRHPSFSFLLPLFLGHCRSGTLTIPSHRPPSPWIYTHHPSFNLTCFPLPHTYLLSYTNVFFAVLPLGFHVVFLVVCSLLPFLRVFVLVAINRPSTRLQFIYSIITQRSGGFLASLSFRTCRDRDTEYKYVDFSLRFGFLSRLTGFLQVQAQVDSRMMMKDFSNEHFDNESQMNWTKCIVCIIIQFIAFLWFLCLLSG